MDDVEREPPAARDPAGRRAPAGDAPGDDAAAIEVRYDAGPDVEDEPEPGDDETPEALDLPMPVL